MRRNDAAIYVGIGITKFDELVEDGRMPKPIRLDGCLIWDVHLLDESFDQLSDSHVANEWDN